MKTIRLNNLCRVLQQRKVGLFDSFRQHVQHRLIEHMANCPRCRKRLGLASRLEIALAMIKSQPHHIDLLQRANTQTLAVFAHALRYAPKSQTLRISRPEPILAVKNRSLIDRLLNIAACLFVVLMMRSGIFHSLTSYKEQSEAVIHNYYARNLDSNMFNEIFPNNDTLA